MNHISDQLRCALLLCWNVFWTWFYPSFGKYKKKSTLSIVFCLLYAFESWPCDLLPSGAQNKCAKFLLSCLKCCFWCLEKFIKFLNRNAYIMVHFLSFVRCFWLGSISSARLPLYCSNTIAETKGELYWGVLSFQVAIYGKNFCTSAKDAFFLLMRNIVRWVLVFYLRFCGNKQLKQSRFESLYLTCFLVWWFLTKWQTSSYFWANSLSLELWVSDLRTDWHRCHVNPEVIWLALTSHFPIHQCNTECCFFSSQEFVPSSFSRASLR